MANLTGFDAKNVDPMVEFEAIPAGKYVAIITNSEMKPTKSGNGSYLEIEFEVIEGECKGRKLWSRLNLDNPKDLTVKIAKAELSAICRAVNVLAPKDSCELHNIPMTITVKCRKRTDTGEMANDVRGYSRKEAASGQPKQAENNVPPWARK